MSEWKPFKEIDFSDLTVNQFHVDTRDFKCNAFEKEVDIALSNWDAIEKYPEHFYHTSEEIMKLLNRLYEESGGEGQWRFLTLKKNDVELFGNWQLKYIRIYRFDEGLLVIVRSNTDYSESIEGIGLDKEMLSFPVDNNPDVLNHY